MKPKPRFKSVKSLIALMLLTGVIMTGWSMAKALGVFSFHL